MKTLSDQKKRMIETAKEKWGKITPCGKSVIFHNGFTEYEGKIYFWFNTKGRNTHMITEDINNG
ncbi:MAG: hypothetical protein GY861_12880 [bacterium]|nr:hypothetical protein [bacterium]